VAARSARHSFSAANGNPVPRDGSGPRSDGDRGRRANRPAVPHPTTSDSSAAAIEIALWQTPPNRSSVASVKRSLAGTPRHAGSDRRL
jgi:hypothetical protein